MTEAENYNRSYLECASAGKSYFNLTRLAFFSARGKKWIESSAE
jgi:hypothetical protein